MTFERHQVRLARGEAPCLVTGSGPPLVYQHAASGPRSSEGLERLAATRTIYIPVLPGFEGTERLPAGSRMPDVARWMADFVTAEFGGPADVAGHSFGGWAACWLAAGRPDLINRLILISPAGFNPEDGAALEGDPGTLLRRAFTHPENRRAETRSPEVIAGNRAAAAAYAAGIVHDRPLAARLGSIPARTLIVYGQKDGVIAPDCPVLLRRGIPASTVTYLDDAAHNVDIDQPSAFASAVEIFLSATESAEAPDRG